MMKILISTIAVMLLCSGCQRGISAEEAQEKHTQVLEEQLEQEHVNAYKAFATKHDIDLNAQKKLLDECRRGPLSSLAIEMKMKKLRRFILKGCITDIVSNPHAEDKSFPYTVFLEDCHRRYTDGSEGDFKYTVSAEEEIVSKLLDKPIGHEQPYIAYVLVNRVVGIIDGNAWRKTYRVNVTALEIEPLPTTLSNELPTTGEQEREKKVEFSKQIDDITPINEARKLVPLSSSHDIMRWTHPNISGADGIRRLNAEILKVQPSRQLGAQPQTVAAFKSKHPYLTDPHDFEVASKQYYQRQGPLYDLLKKAVAKSNHPNELEYFFNKWKPRDILQELQKKGYPTVLMYESNGARKPNDGH